MLIAQSPNSDGIGRYVENLSKLVVCTVRYTSNVLSPLNLFYIYRGFKIVHFPHFVTPLVKLPGQVFVTTIQDITPLYSDELNRLRKLYIYTRIYISFLRSDHIIFTSKYVRDDCKNKFKFKKKYTVIPLGVDYEKFSLCKQKVAIINEYFLIVGRRNKHKNILNMVRAFANADIDKTCSLVFAGQLSEHENLLRAEIKKLNLEDRVKFIGDVEDGHLIALYQNAVSLLYVSHLEGFGLPVLEAYAAGCPVITSTTASLPEVSGGLATLVHPNDINGIADAIEYHFKNKCVGDLIESAKKHAQSYTWESTAEKTSEVYLKLMKC